MSTPCTRSSSRLWSWRLGDLPARRRLAGVVLAAGLFWAPSAGAVAIYAFDLPATGLPSLATPYPNVAILTLSQTADGVQFVLDPNEASPGYGSSSFVQRLDIAYSGAPLAASDFRTDSGVAGSFGFETNPHNFDAGYRARDAHISVVFPSAKHDRLTPDGTSVWTVLGAQLSDFTGTFATAHNKPSAIYAVLSVTGYSLPGHRPSPSNWVAVVPEPGTAGLLLVGLGVLHAARRRTASV